MLTRVLEPEVMDTQAEAIAYDDMDHDEVNRRFVADLFAAGEVRDEILDLGTGTARIPLLVCEQDENVRVVAVDLSVNMLEIAHLHVALSSHGSRVLLNRIDAKELPFEAARFAVVMSNSIIHHIPQPARVLAESVRVCQAGGLLFFRDLSRPGSDAELQQLVERYTDGESDHARRLFADSLRAALTRAEMQELVQTLGFRRETVQATSDRHWTWCAVKPVA